MMTRKKLSRTARLLRSVKTKPGLTSHQLSLRTEGHT